MWPYHPDLLARPVPRYTSYPTAAEFGPVDPGFAREPIARATGALSVYLHIPFCEKICFYCGCNTARVNRRARLQSYLDALTGEIAQIGALLPADARVARISLGGGSPNALAPDQLAALIEALDHHWRLADPVLSIECDPRSMSADFARAMASIGFDRASLGVQTLAPHCQRAIGRVQDDRVIAQSVEWLRAAGIKSLNFDLMYGLPRQSREDLEDSLEKSVRLGADRIALFGYAHVPHLVARQRAIDTQSLPGPQERFAQAAQGHEFLQARGYQAVGFDHFALERDPLARAARSGRLRRNFQGFTDDEAETLIGLGASAISCFEDRIVQNEKNAGRYRMAARGERGVAARGVARSREDRRRARIIEHLLCLRAADAGPCLDGALRARLEPFAARGLLRIDGSRVAILPQGTPYARAIAAQFDRYRDAGPGQFSAAV